MGTVVFEPELGYEQASVWQHAHASRGVGLVGGEAELAPILDPPKVAVHRRFHVTGDLLNTSHGESQRYQERSRSQTMGWAGGTRRLGAAGCWRLWGGIWGRGGSRRRPPRPAPSAPRRRTRPGPAPPARSWSARSRPGISPAAPRPAPQRSERREERRGKWERNKGREEKWADGRPVLEPLDLEALLGVQWAVPAHAPALAHPPPVSLSDRATGGPEQPNLLFLTIEIVLGSHSLMGATEICLAATPCSGRSPRHVG